MPNPDDADTTPIPSDLGELFTELAQKNDRVCAECFTRLARRERFPQGVGHDYASILSFVETVVPDDAKWDLLDREYYERVQLEERTHTGYPPTERPTTGSTTVCSNCGTCSPYRGPSAPRPTRVATNHAENLSDTLDEYGITHDREHLIATVETLKHDSEWTSRDRDIYARAVAESVYVALHDHRATDAADLAVDPAETHQRGDTEPE